MDVDYYIFSCFRYSLLLLLPQSISCLDLIASVSQHGVRGEIKFTGAGDDGAAVTSVTADLEVSLGSEGEYTWGIYEFPIDYTKVGRMMMMIK